MVLRDALLAILIVALAALAYWIVLAIGGPVIVGIIAAIIVLLGGFGNTRL
jgi:hypothetical protein